MQRWVSKPKIKLFKKTWMHRFGNKFWRYLKYCRILNVGNVSQNNLNINNKIWKIIMNEVSQDQQLANKSGGKKSLEETWTLSLYPLSHYNLSLLSCQSNKAKVSKIIWYSQGEMLSSVSNWSACWSELLSQERIAEQLKTMASFPTPGLDTPGQEYYLHKCQTNALILKEKWRFSLASVIRLSSRGDKFRGEEEKVHTFL